MTDAQDLYDAVVAWLAAVTAPSRNTAFATNLVTRVPEWLAVVNQIAAVATQDRRPELWWDPDHEPLKPLNPSVPRVSALQILRDTGLSAVWRLGSEIDVDAVASSFVAAMEAPSPQVEMWWLTDLDLRPGTSISIGDHILETMTREQLVDLAPLPPIYNLLPARQRIDADLFQGSAFLHHRSDHPPARGIRFGHPTSRPELRVWRPLLALMLWRRELARVEASWAVEPRRRIDVLHDNATIYEYFDEENGERHARGPYEALDDPSVDALAAFATAVDGCVATILGSAIPGRKRKPARVLRLQRAAEHLVRATQRSFNIVGERDEGERDERDEGERDDGERDEILLHYVIAIEALLAAEKDELTRRVSQRAAALFPVDDERLFVEDTVKKAYANRPNYAHGDATGEYNLEQIREVALAITLRWIILQTAEPDGTALLPRLDRSLLSEGVRRADVVEPLETFMENLTVPLGTLRSRPN